MKSLSVLSKLTLVSNSVYLLLALQPLHKVHATEQALIPLSGLQTTNPYHGNRAIRKIGYRLYMANCSQCHGVDAVSEAKAPDLRFLPSEQYGDTLFFNAATNGKGVMPAFRGKLTQEEMWAIRTWVETMPNGDE